MSGHSKWSTIKRSKGVADAKRGQLFTKLSRDISIAVKQGGSPDPNMNYRLRIAVDKAKNSNMPSDTIDRALSMASGNSGGQEAFEEITYEGYGPGGTAIMLETITDNRNRTASEIRSVFTKSGGNLGESGCVSWNFESKGILIVDTNQENADDIALIAIDAGAEDVQIDTGFLEILVRPDEFQELRNKLEQQNITISSGDLSKLPTSTIALGPKEAEQTLRLLDNLEDILDVQRVYSNADFPDQILDQYKIQG